jgi:hypothetical protein
MDRKNFLKKALTGAGMIAAGGAVAAVIKNDIDELKPLDLSKQVGFNHHPGHATVMNDNTVLHKAQSRGSADLAGSRRIILFRLQTTTIRTECISVRCEC